MARTKSVTAVDVAIGQRLRVFRRAAGLSQTEVGKKLGVTFQQIQKYENGKNRLSGSRIVVVADLLKVAPDKLLGVSRSHNGPAVDSYTLLADRAVNACVLALSKLSHPKRGAALAALRAIVTALQ